MARAGTAKMVPGASYPSPTSAQISEGPFYASQHQMPTADEMQLAQIARRGPPNIDERDREGEDRAQAARRHSQDLRHAQLASPQQLAQSGLDSTPNYDPNAADSASRKRTKVSRACDECRRKKIRCDAASESMGAQCSGCKRSDSTCMFSRTPQKRGPSKGYIKELAERVGALEGRRPMAPVSGYQYSGFEYSPQPEDVVYGSRKRTHSLSEGLPNSTYGQEQNPESSVRYPPASNLDWPNRDTRSQLHTNPHFPNDINNDNPPQTLSHAISASLLGRDTHRNPTEPIDSMDNRQIQQVEVSFTWDEYAVDEYYRLIHPTFPVLPNSKIQLVSHLTSARDDVREAFLAALFKVTHPNPSTLMTNSHNGNENTKATELLAGLQMEEAGARSQLDNLVFLQSLILMILAIDLSAVAYVQRPIWYSPAYSVSEVLNLRRLRPFGSLDESVLALNSMEMIGRRAWLILVTLDRWHSAGTFDPLLVTDKAVLLHPGDHELLGDTAFHITRLSLTIGHIIEELLDPLSSHTIDSPSEQSIIRLLNGEMDRFRESVESNFLTWPLVHLSFLHAKLLIKRRPITEPDEIIALALNIISVLCADHNPKTLLVHHIAGQAAVALTEASQSTKNNELALRGLHDLRLWLEKSQSGNANWEAIIINYIATKGHGSQQAPPNNGTPIDRGGLQHLADAAVGETEAASGDRDADDAPRTTSAEVAANWNVGPVKGYMRILNPLK